MGKRMVGQIILELREGIQILWSSNTPEKRSENRNLHYT